MTANPVRCGLIARGSRLLPSVSLKLCCGAKCWAVFLQVVPFGTPSSSAEGTSDAEHFSDAEGAPPERVVPKPASGSKPAAATSKRRSRKRARPLAAGVGKGAPARGAARTATQQKFIPGCGIAPSRLAQCAPGRFYV